MSRNPFSISTPNATPTNQPTYLSRPSWTYSEFTGRSQQPSGPVHPPHPSRSSLAAARSMSERKDDRNLDPSFTEKPAQKSYSDQIDEVMEKLNANCDLSMDDLFGAATSASTSTLNASTSTPDKQNRKLRKLAGLDGQGLTKKSNSTSQLSVSGRFFV